MKEQQFKDFMSELALGHLEGSSQSWDVKYKDYCDEYKVYPKDSTEPSYIVEVIFRYFGHDTDNPMFISATLIDYNTDEERSLSEDELNSIRNILDI